MKQKLPLYLLIAGLSGIAVVLGFTLYKAPSSSVSPPAPPVSSGDSSSEENLSDEIAVLQFPTAESSAEEKFQYEQLLSKLGVKGDTLTIEACKPDPLVLRVDLGERITIINRDTSERRLGFAPDHVVVVPAEGSIEITADMEHFVHGAGAYGYGCDTSQGMVGVVHVITRLN